MESNTQKPQDIVDATDSLEAVGASRSMKNFLFFVILIGLLLPQVIFWLDQLGLIEEKCCMPCHIRRSCSPVEKPACPESVQEKQAVTPAGPLPLAATVNVAEEVEKVTEEIEQNQPRTETVEEKEILLGEETNDMSAETPREQAATGSETQDEAPFRLSCYFVKTVVAICNFLVILGSILYCLTLLMCLKISLTGRLGGMNHITKAFFISLFLMVIVFPWQQLLPGVLVGALWLPGRTVLWRVGQSTKPDVLESPVLCTILRAVVYRDMVFVLGTDSNRKMGTRNSAASGGRTIK